MLIFYVYFEFTKTVILTFEKNKFWYWKRDLNYFLIFVHFDRCVLNQLNDKQV